MKASNTLAALAIVALAACEAGTTAPQIEAGEPGTTEVGPPADTEPADVYLVDQLIYSEEPLSDAELLVVVGDHWTVALLQGEVAGNMQVSVGRASSFMIDFGEPERSSVPR